MIERVLFYITPSDAWERVVREWIERASMSLFSGRFARIIVPDMSVAALIKRQAVLEKVPLAGIDFMSLGLAKERLLDEKKGHKCARREDVLLLIRMAATQLMASNAEGDSEAHAIARTALQSPEFFGDTFERLDSTGIELVAAHVQPLAKTFFALLAEAGKATTATMDYQDDETGDDSGDCLIYGFSAQDFEKLPLLAALGRRAQTLLVSPMQPYSRLGMLWNSTLEEWFGVADMELGESPETTGERIAESRERLSVLDEEHKGFLSTLSCLNTEDESLYAVHLAQQKALEKTDSLPVAIVVPHAAHPCGRLIAQRLSEQGVPHFDALGHSPGKAINHTLFTSWINWQRSFRAADAIAFADNLTSLAPERSQGLQGVKGELERASLECSANTLVLVAYCEEPEYRRSHRFFLEWQHLPDSLTFEGFMDAVKPILNKLGWPTSLCQLNERAEPLKRLKSFTIQRGHFLGWLEATLKTPGRTRGKDGREPFSDLYLLTLSQARAGAWSSVLFCGMQKDTWMPDEDQFSFLDAEEIRAQREVSVIESSSGEGEKAFAPGSRILLSNAEVQEGFRMAFHEVLVHTHGPVFALHSRRSINDGSSLAVPADDWYSLHYIQTGGIQEAQRLDAEAEALNRVLKKHEKGQAKTSAHQGLLTAWKSRRDPEKLFDEWGMALEGGLQRLSRMSVRGIEQLVTAPTTAWFESVLGCPRSADIRNRSRDEQFKGVLIHRWLCLEGNPTGEESRAASVASLPGLIALPDEDLWVAEVRKASEVYHEKLHQAYTKARLRIPEVQLAEYKTLQSIALLFARQLSTLGGTYNRVGSEMSMSLDVRNLDTRLDSRQSLAISGVVDLVFVNESAHEAPSCLILDIKTGSNNRLTLKDLSKGKGLQVVLYGYAVEKHIGNRNIGLGILKSGFTPEVQVTLEDIKCHEDIQNLFQRLIRWGVAGELKPTYSNRSQSNTPLAFLETPADILDKKWARTAEAIRKKAVSASETADA